MKLMVIGATGNIGQPVLQHAVVDLGTENEIATALLQLMVAKFVQERCIKLIHTAIPLIVLSGQVSSSKNIFIRCLQCF